MPLTVENGGIDTRDFIYVDDIVRGLMLCATRGNAGGVYNLASGVETTILELATAIDKLTENATTIDYLPKRNWDNSGKRFGSIGKAQQELGFEAQVDLQKGLEQTVAWTSKHIDFIDACITKHKSHMPALN